VSRPFNLALVIEKVPKALLQRFLSQFRGFSDLDWTKLPPNDPEPILKTLYAFSEPDKSRIVMRLRQVHALADSQGAAVLCNAARDCQLPQVAAMFATMKNHFERAFWCLAEQPKVFNHEWVYAYVYCLRRSARETRLGFPPGKIQIGRTQINRITELIREIYRVEGRAELCKVDHWEQDALHVFHAYPSDFLDQIDSYDATGELTSISIRPPFHIVFQVDGQAGSVNLLCQAGGARHDELFKRFSMAVYGVPPPARAKRAFDLQALRDPAHEFRRDPRHCIAALRVTALRLQFPENARHRALFEVDRADPDDSIFDLIGKKLSGGLRTLAKAKILSAEFQAIFRSPGEPEKIVNFKITVPRWCDLDDDPEGRILSGYLPAWGLQGNG
jgi:hypothetical protein